MKNSLRTLLLSSTILALSAFAFAQAPAGAPGGRAGGMGGAPGGMGGAPGGMGGMPGGMGGMPGGMGGAPGGMGGMPGGAPSGRTGGMGGAPRQAGPPAPIPPQVAIPRPSAEELAKVKADIAQFIETSPDKDLLKKYPNLVTVTEPRANSAVAPVQTGVRTDARHNPFVETANKGDFDILFEGDSITDYWQNSGANNGKEVFDKHFGDSKVANFAIGGDTTQGLVWGLQNGEGKGNPKAIMLMIGTNNTGSNTGPEIAEGVGAVVLELRKDFPNAKILLLAIFPRGTGPTDANRLKNDEANKIIAKLDDGKNIFFKSINDKFLKPDGSLIGFRNDNLHPNAEGYEIWANEVEGILKGWCK